MWALQAAATKSCCSSDIGQAQPSQICCAEGWPVGNGNGVGGVLTWCAAVQEESNRRANQDKLGQLGLMQLLVALSIPGAPSAAVRAQVRRGRACGAYSSTDGDAGTTRLLERMCDMCWNGTC